MRTTLELPDPLFREVKAHAARHGLKLKELLATYIEDGLRGTIRKPVAAARSPLPIARRATGITIPALTNSQIAEILDLEDAKLAHGEP